MPIFDKDKSKIKLWVGTGSQKGDVFYSIISQDKKTELAIIEKMKKRILERKYKGVFTTAKFYNNKTGKLITTISSKKTDKLTAQIKLWIGMPNDVPNLTYYNLTLYNNNLRTEIIEIMKEKILKQQLKGQFTKAIFYNNQTGAELYKLNGNFVGT